jgi:hypothetical protein
MPFLMQKLESLAPDVWQVLGVLLAADPQSNYQQNCTEKQKQMKTKQQKQNRVADDIEMQDIGDDSDHDSDAKYWAGMQTLIPKEQDELEDILDHVKEQQRGLVVIHTYNEEQHALMS